MPDYLLLVPGGLEGPACAEINSGVDDVRVEAVPPVDVRAGTCAGVAGGMTLVLSFSGKATACGSGIAAHCGRLAGVVQCDLDEGDVCDAERVASVLHAHERACTLHRDVGSTPCDGRRWHWRVNAHLAFRVATLRAGEHSFTSKALDAAFGTPSRACSPSGEWTWRHRT